MNKFVLSFELIDSPLLPVAAVIAGLGVVAVFLWAPRRLIRTAVVAAAADYDASLAVLGAPGSELLRAAEAAGLEIGERDAVALAFLAQTCGAVQP